MDWLAPLLSLIGVLVLILNAIALKMLSDLRDDIKNEATRRHQQFDNLTPLLADMQMDVSRHGARLDDHDRRLTVLEKQ